MNFKVKYVSIKYRIFVVTQEGIKQNFNGKTGNIVPWFI